MSEGRGIEGLDDITGPPCHSRTFKAMATDCLRNLLHPCQWWAWPRNLQAEPWVHEVLEVQKMKMDQSVAEVEGPMDSDDLASSRRWMVWGLEELERSSCARRLSKDSRSLEAPRLPWAAMFDALDLLEVLEGRSCGP